MESTFFTRHKNLHTVYKAISPEEMDRILAYCKEHTLFEIYPGEEGSQQTVIVNSRQENEPLKNFKPLGAFYCNYLGEGIIFFSPESSSNHIFVSTPKSNNHKMRVGDSIDSATLMKIESTGAVFTYQGETAFLNIGR